MQPFRLRKDARNWFKDLREDDSFKIDFDIFYFCFIAGISKSRKLHITNEHAPELVASFPGRYTDRGKLLVALFLAKELEILGVTMNEKKVVHSSIAKLVDPTAPHNLSDEGVKHFNQYAHGGYDVLLEWFSGDRPRSLETFLRIFKQNLDTTLVPTV
ncbi:hypothetical protein [Streptomyces roseochromogenus]|uniref:Uncharacterized protein n=1 Tax=Streptomyces roseochromogenus subsp. oscitans DS 12.976 TaxID=1352936 RepID=V6K445_STRRC|nr:hypothetical protein [Streptomyces roseochromogenus]EST26975.1 hypothetical protein M878_26130 [Streptomyces roseochromogenus subsp. oscitans DS 12.976]